MGRDFALAFVIVLLSGVFLGVVCVQPVKAQYQELGVLPPDSNTFPPQVTILFPQNDSAILANKTPLTFNVTLPESSTAYNTVIWSIICQTDWQNQTIDVYTNNGDHNSIDKLHPNPANHYFYGTINLTDLPQGTRTLNVTAIAGGTYLTHREGYGPAYYEFNINGSTSLTFTAAYTTPAPTVPEFSSWTLPLLLSIVAATAGLLVYHKKRSLVKKP